LLAVFAVLLAVIGALIISRNVAQPLVAITCVTEEVADGDASVTVPFGDRHEEIGALARSINVFQEVMWRNADLYRTVTEEANSRLGRQQHVSVEISRFSKEVEATLSELGRICVHMLAV